MISLDPSSFVARFTSSRVETPTSQIPAIVGSTDPKRAADQQVVGSTLDTLGGWVKRAAELAWDANPLSLSTKVAVPIAAGVADAGAGVKEVLTSSTHAVSDGISSTFTAVKWTLVIIVVLGAVYGATIIAQPIIAARSLAK